MSKTYGIHDVQMRYNKETDEIEILLPGNSSDPTKIIRLPNGGASLYPVISVDKGDPLKLGFFHKVDDEQPQYGEIPNAVDLPTALVTLADLVAMARSYGLVAES